MPATGKRRAYGQHFLRDQTVINSTVTTFLDELAKHGCASALEIGPGKGALTYPLLERCPVPVLVCEKDARIGKVWQETSALHPRARFVIGDFLELPVADWIGGAPLGVISNLPYSSGTAILQVLAQEWKSIPCMVLMFQREVARRLRAEPDTREWGSLSLWIQNRWDVTKVIDAPPGAFSPPPEVHSEVVRMVRRETPRVPVGPDDEARWEKLLKTCFTQRRKMLRSSLPKDGPWRPALEKAGIDPTLRAEALGWDQWRSFFLSLEG